MHPRYATPAAALADLTERRLAYAVRNQAPLKAVRIDHRPAYVPWPAHLAQHFAADALADAGISRALGAGWTRRVDGTFTAARLTVREVEAILLDLLRELPRQASATPVYTAVVEFVHRGDPAAVARYVAATVAASRYSVPECPYPLDATSSGPPRLSDRDRMRRARADARIGREASASAVLALLFEGGQLVEGARITRGDLVAMIDQLDDAPAAFENTAGATRIITQEADRLFGPRERGRLRGTTARYWTVPSPESIRPRLAESGHGVALG